MNNNPCYEEYQALRKAIEELSLAPRSGLPPSFKTVEEVGDSEPITITIEQLQQMQKADTQANLLREKVIEADRALNDCQKRHGLDRLSAD